MAAKNCEDCGVKLTMLNRHLKYKEKCHPCGHKEFVRVKEERGKPRFCSDCGTEIDTAEKHWRLKDGSGFLCNACDEERKKKAAVQQPPAKQVKADWEYATYLEGFSGVTSKKEITLRFEATQVAVEKYAVLGQGRALWVMPYNKIKDVSIDTAEHLTAARLLLTGVVAFGLKKKEHYLIVSFEDQNGLMQHPVFEGKRINKVQKMIYERITQARQAQAPVPPVDQQPQAATIDVAEQIKKLGELRDQGLLTEQEFDSKKQELLARM